MHRILYVYGMKVMLKIILFLFIGNCVVNAQTHFPADWTGSYKGDLLIYGIDSVNMHIKMKLDIVKTANDAIYDWKITYSFNGKKDLRPYRLLVVDKEKGHYQIDEKNSIVIDAYLHNNKVFTSFFKVKNSVVIATYTKSGDAIIFEIISGKDKPVSITGNTKQGEEEIPEVASFLVNGRQKAVLKKSE